MQKNFNPRPPRGGRLPGYALKLALLSISIHVLREEDDSSTYKRAQNNLQFQSTSSARRTTQHCISVCFASINFNPRPPRGGRPNSRINRFLSLVFQSTSSARRTTKDFDKIIYQLTISIHVLREEDDLSSFSPIGRPRISIHVLREEDDFTIKNKVIHKR